jgi:hypothetical protein
LGGPLLLMVALFLGDQQAAVDTIAIPVLGEA